MIMVENKSLRNLLKCEDCGLAIRDNSNTVTKHVRCWVCQCKKEDADFIEQYDNLHCRDEYGNWV